MDLYHADIKLPEGFTLPTARVALRWTKHAEGARKDDRYGTIPKFASIPLSAFKVVEVGVENKKIAKVVIRGHYTKTVDVIFVLIPQIRGAWVVKTVWQNLRTDQHQTLDRSRYVC